MAVATHEDDIHDANGKVPINRFALGHIAHSGNGLVEVYDLDLLESVYGYDVGE